jgi:twitching motility protein PilJ
VPGKTIWQAEHENLMELTFNLDEPIEDGMGGPGQNFGAPPPGKEPPENMPKRLRLPLIGGLPVNLQLQVLAASFLVLIALAVFVGVMDSRTTAYSAAHLGIGSEIGILTERMARLAPAAEGVPPALNELKAARDREAQLITLLENGGEANGRSFAAVDASLRPTLDAVRMQWTQFTNALQPFLSAHVETPVASSATAAAGTDNATKPATPDRLVPVLKSYALLRDAIAVFNNATTDTLGKHSRSRAMIAAAGSVSMLMLVLFFRVFNDDAAARQTLLTHQRRIAEIANAETQAAIRQLMDEMTNLADGDLTVRASVSENFTGGIADAMNYAAEELSVLVKRINDAATRVTIASGAAARTSEELLTASETQSQEIRRASSQVLSMAQSMNDVSGKAEESANVARQSLDAANNGAAAVANSISGMDGIRSQIQETSKRIKRLGESSQEIGEIVELISDITEQTNVLALNAAIQAASAGEAGRGFTVVAEEVQRLAERSATATRRIAALVKTIQSDTHDAVSAMENSTQGVIEGARLSDAAGRALTDISSISRQLAELIEGISGDTRQQAEVATRVAQTMREILRITEQTSSGTRSTAISISELADLAIELKGSVAGFKV